MKDDLEVWLQQSIEGTGMFAGEEDARITEEVRNMQAGNDDLEWWLQQSLDKTGVFAGVEGRRIEERARACMSRSLQERCRAEVRSVGEASGPTGERRPRAERAIPRESSGLEIARGTKRVRLC